MRRRNARRVSVCVPVLIVAFSMMTSAARLNAQSDGFSDSYRFRDSASVGFVPMTGGFGWGVYPYRISRVAPAGEFGGYLYRSPDDFMNFGAPEYVPIAAANIGMPVANAGGRVLLTDVPMWTDEWAARIVQNRAAAGIAADSLVSAQPIRHAPQVERRESVRSIPKSPVAAPVPTMAPKPVPAPTPAPTPRPVLVQPMRPVPATPSPARQEGISPTRPTPIRGNARETAAVIVESKKLEVSLEPDTSAASASPMILNAEDAVSETSASQSEPTTLHDVVNERDELPVHDHAVGATDDRATSGVATKSIEDMAQEFEASIREIEAAARDWESIDRAAETNAPSLAPDVEATSEPVAVTAQASAPTAAAESEASSATEDDAALTSQDLHRATAAGIAIGRGDKAFEQGAYEQARAEYRQAIDAVGDEPGLRIALGLSDYALGSFGDAARAIRRGVARSPELAKSDFHLLDVYGRMTDADLHRRALDNYVSQHPEDADALFVLGFVQFFSGQRHSARTTFGAYRSIVPHDDLADSFIELVLDVRRDPRE